MSFEIRGDFKGMTERISAGVREAALLATGAAMMTGEAEAKKACPVDTGRLKNSITHTYVDAGDAIVGQIGSDVEYAPHVEFGTSKQKAQPYLTPGIMAAKNSAEKYIRKYVARVK